MGVESNIAGNTLQTARAQFLRTGMGLDFLFTLQEKTGPEIGGGILFCRKFYKITNWQLTGGQPSSYFPKSQILAPLQLIQFA